MSVLKSGFKRLPSTPLSPTLLLKTPDVAFWFCISFIAPLYFGLISFFYATSSDYIVQDDARIHVVWLQRLIDPDLFVNDAIATYLEAIQPAGYGILFKLVAAFGIEPLFFAKIAPLMLALVATAYLFWVALRILPVPMSGFLVTLILNQNIWIRDDLISTAPRAFIYPIFSAFLYYLLKDDKVCYLLALGLLGLFYPQMMLVSMGLLTLRLIRWRGAMPTLPNRFADYIPWLVALCLTGGLLLFFSGQVESQVGRLTNLSEMRTWPEFQQGGRGEYFGVSLSDFLFTGSSGIRFPLLPPVILLGFLLPWVVWRSRLRAALPLSSHITQHVSVLGHLAVSAVSLFLLAHLIFPVLFLPSRYSFYSARFTLIIASGIMLTLVMERWLAWLHQRWVRGRWTLLQKTKAGLSLGLAIAIITTPAVPSLFLGGQGWRVGIAPGLFKFVASSPKDTLATSLITDINDNIPAFSQRSVLTGREFALPFHVEFYDEMRQRMTDMVEAQYSPDLQAVKAFIDAYGVDLWIVSKEFAQPAYLDGQVWLLGSSVSGTVMNAQAALKKGLQPALTQTLDICATFVEGDAVVLDGRCIRQLSGN